MMITISNCPICSAPLTKKHLVCTDYMTSQERFQINVCDNCCFGVTTPRPQDLGPYYLSDDYISHSKTAKSAFDLVYRTARKFTLHNKYKLILADQSAINLRVLDVGCGTGEFLKYLESKSIYVTGVEPSEKAALLAKEIKGNVYTSLEELSTKVFNIITLWHVLEHIPDLDTTLQQLREKLSSDGTIYIAVPNFQSYDANYYGEYWAGYDVPRHLWHFSQTSMTRLLSKNKLKLVNTLPMKLDSFYVSLLSEKYKRNQSTIAGTTAATFNGLKSNVVANKNSEYSSLIYVIQPE